MKVLAVGSDTVVVSYDGIVLGGGGFRQRYAYSIITRDWRYQNNDIKSGVGASVDENDAARTLFTFLSACAESRDYRDRTANHGYVGENADLFPDHIGQWAQDHSDEISLLFRRYAYSLEEQ